MGISIRSNEADGGEMGFLGDERGILGEMGGISGQHHRAPRGRADVRILWRKNTDGDMGSGIWLNRNVDLEEKRGFFF